MKNNKRKLSLRVDVLIDSPDCIIADSVTDDIPNRLEKALNCQHTEYVVRITDIMQIDDIGDANGTQYAERDAMALDVAGGYYTKHVCAMTSEQLHSKGDIAAELAYRDFVIDDLNHALTIALNNVEAMSTVAAKALQTVGSSQRLMQDVAVIFESSVGLLTKLKPEFAMEMTYPTELQVNGKLISPVETVAKYETEDDFIRECENVAATDTFTEYTRTTSNTHNME